jgi:tetratricopeptide (TPR) repeat protein
MIEAYHVKAPAVPRDTMPDRIAQLKAMLESEPNDPFCLYGMAMEYAKLGQDQSATSWFDLAIAADPDYTYAYYHKAKSQEAVGDARGAAATLREGMERARLAGDAKALNEIGAYLDELDQAPDDDRDRR